MQGKVLKVSFIDSYDSKYGKMYNFAVLFENDKQAYMLSAQKEEPPCSVGEELEFTAVENKESQDGLSHFTKNVNGHQVDCVKIKKEQKKGFGGKGGYARQPKSVEEYKNDMVSFSAGFAKDIMLNRLDLMNTAKTPEEIVGVFKNLHDSICEHMQNKIK